MLSRFDTRYLAGYVLRTIRQHYFGLADNIFEVRLIIHIKARPGFKQKEQLPAHWSHIYCTIARTLILPLMHHRKILCFRNIIHVRMAKWRDHIQWRLLFTFTQVRRLTITLPMVSLLCQRCFKAYIIHHPC